MQTQLQIIGFILIVLALVHIAFPKYFDWQNGLKSLSLINKQIFQVHTFFIAFTVFLMGLLCITSAEQLITTSLGKTISLGLGIFWSVRLLFQFFVYSPKLWKGKTFETSVHIVFTLLWIYLSTLFLFIYFQ
ncbi:hypothetical protein [Leeuwenhoekiella sp. NPDC079379]|uniref:hypothetical protein n=1 Tax=Leeuwenhoekiella sp. NPDC079379 TaxID=3364122 RepID=UPI0037CBCE4C